MAISEERKRYLAEWREKNKEKRNAYLAEWRANNRDKTRAANKKWAAKNREEIRIKALEEGKKRAVSGYYKKWREKNREKHREYHRNYYHDNPGRKTQVLISVRKRQAAKLSATPCWLSEEHIKEIGRFYIEAAMVGLTVDHIIPLQGVIVCGLHVPWNLQLMSHSDNSGKGNRFAQDEEYL